MQVEEKLCQVMNAKILRMTELTTLVVIVNSMQTTLKLCADGEKAMFPLMRGFAMMY